MNQEAQRWWVPYISDVTSQHGEDGVIEEVFRRIGATNKWCVEFGALNGTHHSNTWDLITNRGWSGVLIEADPTYFEKLKEVYAALPRAHCLNEFVEFEGPHSLDAILARTPIPKDFDFLSIDIDGNDYHVWESLVEYQPRVVVMEFNPTIPTDISFVQPRDMSVQQGSSIKALIELGEKKGYTAVAVTGVNIFFVRSELFAKLGIDKSTIEELYPDTSLYTRVFQLYDGTLVLDGYKRLFWHNLPIDEDDIQVLPAHQRRYLSGVSSHPVVRVSKYWVRKLPFYAWLQRLRK
jgi:hypothetical protein